MTDNNQPYTPGSLSGSSQGSTPDAAGSGAAGAQWQRPSAPTGSAPNPSVPNPSAPGQPVIGQPGPGQPGREHWTPGQPHGAQQGGQPHPPQFAPSGTPLSQQGQGSVPQHSGQNVPGQGPQPGQTPDAHRVAKNLADGEWHRMHPLTPFLRGGFSLIIFAGIMLTWGRDRIINLFVPSEFNYYDDEGDPISWLLNSGFFWLAIAAFIVIVLLFIAGFYFSWRKREFRVTGDVVELKEGILNRKHRRAPLQRIQGIEVQKPWFARMVGCAKLDIEQAGADGKVELAYIGIPVARALREEILNRASGRSRDLQRSAAGTSQPGSAPQPGAASSPAQHEGLAGRVDDVRQEFLGPDPELQRYEQTLFKLSPGRLIGSSLLSSLPILIIFGIGAIAIGIAVSFSDEGALIGVFVTLLSMLPALIGVIVATISSIVSQMRFTVAKTQDGIRLSRGLATVTTQTVPPGRVFSLKLSQPLTWRPFGWWKITYGRAVQPSSSGNSNSNQAALGTTLLPVGSLDDVFRVLNLVLREEDVRFLIEQGMLGKGQPGDGFVVSPPRARIFRWFSRKRNGMHIRDSMFVLRKGAIWRSADVLPAARVQSVGMTQGPIYGLAGLAHLQFHTVGILGSKNIGAMDARDAMRAFDHAYPTVRNAMVSDRSESWGITPKGAEPSRVPVTHGLPEGPPPSPAYPAPSTGFGFVAGAQQSRSLPAQNPSAHREPGPGSPWTQPPSAPRRDGGNVAGAGADASSNRPSAPQVPQHGSTPSAPQTPNPMLGSPEAGPGSVPPAGHAPREHTPFAFEPPISSVPKFSEGESTLSERPSAAPPTAHRQESAMPEQQKPSSPEPVHPGVPGPGVEFPERPPMKHTRVEAPTDLEGAATPPVAPPNVRPGIAGSEDTPADGSRREPPANDDAIPGPIVSRRQLRSNPPPVTGSEVPSGPSSEEADQQWSRRNPPTVPSAGSAPTEDAEGR